ncbi:bZIP transcription factor 12-like [Macadamia integrifolia]|uniref:bZIP transcription factor 12-like n=1 Tax=Macadamia integrifolia TaxID=60698 RepID=UPI001C4F983D|nr:bZIP transcription factor 12-like [Macadamia integrifolia]XP_042493252.1 bZIP transcription factor 12-like [Macadamia integrifolia]XP_042493254.1 bZIP transcription factor 12-like [Macadamia integrifolia]
MASKVMASSSSANSDLTRQSSIYSLTVSELQNDQSKNFGSMNMDELFKNIYGDNPVAAAEIIPNAANGVSSGDGESNGGIMSVGNKSVEEVWKDIVARAGCGDVDQKHRDVDVDQAYEEMTLEDFLAKAGAVREEDVRVTQVAGPAQGAFPVDSMLNDRFQQLQQQQGSQQRPQPPQIDGSVPVFRNGVERTGVGRGKRRVVEEPVDKVTQQRQRRMIKNRESAARSRERKQAYTVELESLVSQLEEENAKLSRELEEEKKKRIKQLMENVIPVVDKRRPPFGLRRVLSMQW